MSKIVVNSIRPISKDAGIIEISSDTRLEYPGQIIQVVTNRVDTDSSYAAPTAGAGTDITPLTTSIYPTDPNNLIVAKFMVNGESQQDCVFLVKVARQTYTPPVTEEPSPVNFAFFDAPGTYSWTVPENVTEISVVCVGGGGASSRGNAGDGGGGGGSGGSLGYVNNLVVTPGETLTVIVGAGGAAVTTAGAKGGDGGFSRISRGTTHFVTAPGGRGGNVYGASPGAQPPDAASFSGTGSSTTGGGVGGGGGGGYNGGGGGGGAGGYDGAGGNGGGSISSRLYNSSFDAVGVGAGGGGAGHNLSGGTGNGGGGNGGAGQNDTTGGGGGGAWLGFVGITTNGGDGNGSTSAPSIGGKGGFPGGGSGGAYDNNTSVSVAGASGAVRINWGANSTFPPAAAVSAEAPKIFNISPAVNGKTVWNTDVDGPLVLDSHGTWTMTPVDYFSTTTKIWGGGGGVTTISQTAYGGGGGAANGTVKFSKSVSYDLIVGQGGGGVASNRNAGGGGAGSGIQVTASADPILVAGGGGGSYSTAGRRAGAGGGTTGQAGDGAAGGPGGTQTGPGIGVSGGRRTGASGVGRNGGQLGTGSSATRTSTGFGTGGAGAYNGGDAGSGGGGSGYYGGAEGGGDAAGFGGGGGSGYFNPDRVTNATLYQGNYEIPGNVDDPDRGTAANPGVGISSATFDGAPGKIVITGSGQAGFYSNNNLALASDTGYGGLNSSGPVGNWQGYVSAFYDNDTNSTPSNYFIEYHIPAGQCDRLDVGLAIRSSTTGAGIFTLNRAYTINSGTNYEFAVSTVILMEIKQ